MSLELYDVVYWVDTPEGRKRVLHPCASESADKAVAYVVERIREAGLQPVALASCTIVTGTRN